MKKSVTLIELMVVITVLGILAALALLNINKINLKTFATTSYENVRNVQLASDRYNLKSGLLPSATQPTAGGTQLVDWTQVVPEYIHNKPKDTDKFDYVVDYNGSISIVNKGESVADILYSETFVNDIYKDPATTGDWLNKSASSSSVYYVDKLKTFDPSVGLDEYTYSEPIKDLNGNMLLGGSYNGGPYITKHDSNLNLISEYRPGGSGFVGSIIQNTAGNYIALGNIGANNVVELDQSFNPIRSIDLTPAISGFGDIVQVGTDYYAIGTSTDSFIAYAAQGGTVSNGSGDIVLMKFDSNLNLLKIKNFGGTAYDQGWSLIVDNDGNVVIAGQTASNLTSLGATAPKGSNDTLIAKFDPNFNLLAINTSVSGDSMDRFTTVIQDASGGYMAAGHAQGNLTSLAAFGGIDTTGTSEAALVAHFDTNLSLIKMLMLNGDRREQFMDIAKLPNNNYAAIGWSTSLTIPEISLNNPANSDYMTLYEIDENLNIASADAILKPLSWDYQEATGMFIEPSGDIVVGAVTYSPYFEYDTNSMSDGSNSNFLLLKVKKSATGFDVYNNTLKSKEINLGSVQNNVKIKVDTTMGSKSSYVFSVSTDNITWHQIPSENLNGTTVIPLPQPSSTLYWKMELYGTPIEMPKVNSVNVYKTTETPTLPLLVFNEEFKNTRFFDEDMSSGDFYWTTGDWRNSGGYIYTYNLSNMGYNKIRVSIDGDIPVGTTVDHIWLWDKDWNAHVDVSAALGGSVDIDISTLTAHSKEMLFDMDITFPAGTNGKFTSIKIYSIE